MYAIRGAIQIEENDADLIKINIPILIQTIIERNNINNTKIISIIFSVTKDLDIYNPATALRDNENWNTIPLFTTQEQYVQNSMEKVIRVLMYINDDKYHSDIKHVYLNGAEKLRLDLNENSN